MAPPRFQAFIGLGANLGDLRATLHAALQALAVAPGQQLLAVSSAWRTAPIDAGGPDYLNAVCQLETCLAPLELLDLLQAIEQQHGRERPYLNAPRTLDLDLLFHSAGPLLTERLTLPHPRLHERAFVLAPLDELCPGLPALFGIDGRPLELHRVADQRVERQGKPLWPLGEGR